MKKYFNVTYRVSDDIWSANLAHAENENDILSYYASKSGVRSNDDVIISDANDYAVEDAQRRGKPIVEVEHVEQKQEQEAPAEAQEPAEKDYFRNGYYDYLEAITDDVKQYIQDEVNLQDFADRDELEEYLQDELWTVDSVTGNASGSYYCNTWKAEEALCHNWDLLAEALQEFGSTVDVLQEGAEALDVTIRCYLLPQAIAEALDDMEVFDNE